MTARPVQFMFVWLLLNSAPLGLMLAVWLLFRRELGALSYWRRGVFLTGAAANTASAAVLLAFFLHAQLTSKPIDLDRIYPVFTMMGLALLAAILSISGNRVSRSVLAVNAVLTFCLWYLAALAASP